MGGETQQRTPGGERLPSLPEMYLELSRKALAKALADQARHEREIVAEARKLINSGAWAASANKLSYPPGANMRIRWSWRNVGNVSYPPLAGQWADPDEVIPGWEVRPRRELRRPRRADCPAARHGLAVGERTAEGGREGRDPNGKRAEGRARAARRGRYRVTFVGVHPVK